MLATTIDSLSLPSTWYPVVEQIQAVTKPPEPAFHEILWSRLGYISGTSSTVTCWPSAQNSIEQLGWSAVETLETYLRFRSFAEDWDAPGMEAYDDL